MPYWQREHEKSKEDEPRVHRDLPRWNTCAIVKPTGLIGCPTAPKVTMMVPGVAMPGENPYLRARGIFGDRSCVIYFVHSGTVSHPSKLTFFASPPEWRAWLEQHHDQLDELWVGFYKRGSGKSSITWPEAVDGALCFGWIDGVRKSLDESSYMIRFTPRKSRSTWSAINIKRLAALKKLGLVHSAGLQAFQRRTEDRSAIYAYEQGKGAKLTAEYEKVFRANKDAWKFFRAQPPWYRRTSSWWVISAKKEETRQKRLARLIDDSAHRRPIPHLARPGTKSRS
jgi:uncharacterized protein YdeI (YjbR/CyaY-like superfamily)